MPARLDSLVGEGGGNPALLPVLVPPEGWIGDPDGDGIVCGGCAKSEEIAAWMRGLEAVEMVSLQALNGLLLVTISEER